MLERGTVVSQTGRFGDGRNCGEADGLEEEEQTNLWIFRAECMGMAKPDATAIIRVAVSR